MKNFIEKFLSWLFPLEEEYIYDYGLSQYELDNLMLGQLYHANLLRRNVDGEVQKEKSN